MSRGFAFLSILITTAVLLVTAGGAYWVLSGGQLYSVPTKNETCETISNVLELDLENYYEGPLVDSHIHMPTGSAIVSKIAGVVGFPSMPVLGKDISQSQINCLFENEGVEQAFGFYLVPKFQSGSSINVFKRSVASNITPFFMPPPVQQLNLDIKATRNLISKNSDFFKGIGELPLYQDSYGNVSPDDEYFVELYKIADEYDLAIMIHVSKTQQPAAEKVVSLYPSVNFLFHGEDYVKWVVYMMETYPNFYYSLDANIAELYSLRGDAKESEIGSDMYINYMENNFEEVLERSLSIWKEAIETHPDRFMWGTDRWFTWTYGPRVGKVLEQFGRAFIGNLDESAQKPFAHQNAENIL